MREYLLSKLVWLLESICVNFGCRDYLEAIILLPALVGAGIIGIMLVVELCRFIPAVVLQIKAVRRWDRKMEKEFVKAQLAALYRAERFLDALYVEFSWHIKHSRKKLLRKQTLIERRISALSK